MPWIKLKDGSTAHVTMGRRGGKLTARDIAAFEELAECLRRHNAEQRSISVCPGCGCYRDRCACDLRES